MKDIFSQEFVTKAYGREMYEEGIGIGRAEGIDIGRAEGIDIGRAEGIDMGRAEGIDIGRAEGIDMGRADIVRNMLRMNLPMEQIAVASGMTPEAILAL